MSEPSQAEANKLLRVLTGKKLKYTVTLHYPDGRRVEFQCDSKVDVKFDDNTRKEWLVHVGGDYTSAAITEWVPGTIILVETNPES